MAAVEVRRSGRLALAQPWLTLGARVLLAGVIGYAGYAKVQNLPLSAFAVKAYQLLPERIAELAGYGLPFLELGVAGLLLLGFGTRAAAVIVAGLLVIFIGGIVSVWARGLSIDCGCFGGGGAVAAGQTRYLEEILRDAGLLALAAAVAIWPRAKFSVDSLVEVDLEAAEPSTEAATEAVAEPSTGERQS